MWEAFTLLAPLFAFMLIPVWIPVIAVVGGKVADLAVQRQRSAG